MYYRIKNDNLLDYADIQYSNDCLETDIITQAELNAHPNKVMVEGGILVLNPNYDNEETAKRQADFESKFLALGENKNYRLMPKGYANAQQSIDTVNAIVNAMGGLSETIAQMVIFYQTPDFSKPEECTEEWLVAHQFHPSPMTVQEWTQFYIEFTTLYANKMYRQELLGE